MGSNTRTRKSRRSQQRLATRKRNAMDTFLKKLDSRDAKKATLDQNRDIRQTSYRLYGFVPNISNTFYQERNRFLGQTSPFHLFTNPANTAFHNLCVNTQFPKGIEHLLGLGLKFCIEAPKPQGQIRNIIESSLPRFRKTIRLHFKFPRQSEDPNSYIPRLYIPSPWVPERMLDRDNVEHALVSMELLLAKAALKLPRCRHLNLHPTQRQCLRELTARNDLIIYPAVKNLGPCIVERTRYIKQVLSEHLENTTNYIMIPNELVDDELQHKEQTFWQSMKNTTPISTQQRNEPIFRAHSTNRHSIRTESLSSIAPTKYTKLEHRKCAPS
jgi:hypothetical protein